MKTNNIKAIAVSSVVAISTVIPFADGQTMVKIKENSGIFTCIEAYSKGKFVHNGEIFNVEFVASNNGSNRSSHSTQPTWLCMTVKGVSSSNQSNLKVRKKLNNLNQINTSDLDKLKANLLNKFSIVSAERKEAIKAHLMRRAS
jgi:hypothetical protein